MANGEWIAIGIIAGAAIMTKPDEASFKSFINEELRKEFANPTKMSNDGLGQLIQLGCVFSANDCAAFVQGFMRYGTKDYVVAKVAAVRLGDNGLNCIGAFQNWWCFDPKETKK